MRGFGSSRQGQHEDQSFVVLSVLLASTHALRPTRWFRYIRIGR